MVLSRLREAILKYLHKNVNEIHTNVSFNPPMNPPISDDGTFYAEEYDVDLRFGDIIQVNGLISATPTFKELNRTSEINDFFIDVSKPKYCVVITPCCSIGENKLILTPLLPIRRDFYKNSYYYEDFTRINRKMNAHQSMPPEEWSKLTPEKQQLRMKEEMEYALVDLFIYPPHLLLLKYSLKVQLPNTMDRVETEMGYYMIDFRNNFRICSNNIVYDKKKGSNNLGHIKLLELSISARSELRDKLSEYYYKPAQEDLIEID